MYSECVFKVRDLGIGFSDRRAVKVLKLTVPLNDEARCAGRVVCSTKRPVFKLCVPFTFVRLPDMFHSVL